MFRFTIREIVLITIIVAVALAWGLSWFQLSRDLEGVRRESEERRISSEAWEEQALRLAARMREAGWRADVTQQSFSLQWPPPEAYAAIVKAKREKAGLTPEGHLRTPTGAKASPAEN